MKTWEYRIIDSEEAYRGGFEEDIKKKDIEEYLNRLGIDGWEIINLDFSAHARKSWFMGGARREIG